MNNFFTECSYAKVNLGLKIINQRPDKYHNIYSIFIQINLHDKLYFIPKINFAEDQEFVAKALCLCKKFSFFNKSFYCFRLGAGNLSHQMGLEVSIANSPSWNDATSFELELVSEDEYIIVNLNSANYFTKSK